MMRRGGHWLIALISLSFVGGCAPHAEHEVIVYTALDEEFSRPIFERFTADTGIAVRAKFDVESTKSVQLTQAIFAERDRPRCDVFWNNEAVNTLRLASDGLLAKYDSPLGSTFPAQYQAADGSWYGFAARARVLVVNTQLVPEAQRPESILDLVNPKWKGRAGIAKPLAGTTATHAACLFAVWGDERAEQFFRTVKSNCRVLGGNKQVARAVADGELAFGLTDTDDAIVELEGGMPVVIVFPDQLTEPGRPDVARAQGGSQDPPLGTLIIPNTLAIVNDAPHRAEAEQLVEYLLAVEGTLAAGPSAQIPLNPAVKEVSRVVPGSDRGDAGLAAGEDARRGSLAGIVVMRVDFAKAAKNWDTAARFLRDEFATAE